MVERLFLENEKVHELLLKDPTKAHLTTIKQILNEASKSENSNFKIWAEQSSQFFLENPKGEDDLYQKLSDFSLKLLELKKISQYQGKYNKFYCPMVDKYWVSQDTVVRNPYAEDMRDCGELLTE
ncbi:hypothetical protein LPTSP4_30650 [Leptospira ryugenii]|uniref:DUF3347 domain-containing protein n=1 Tax=Leptospira ryugenii TaxID=1917863 RepID=A0A2P2E3S5_9LEPT|nr:hypothetical protein LPTSP4_30650 [Leptospira ryugenii]